LCALCVPAWSVVGGIGQHNGAFEPAIDNVQAKTHYVGYLPNSESLVRVLCSIPVRINEDTSNHSEKSWLVRTFHCVVLLCDVILV